jgi:hypothetical protein
MPKLTAPENIPTLNRSIQRLETFRGVDYTTGPTEVDERRSSDAPNMIRDVPGKVRKRMGYYLTDTYEGRINGVHVLKTDQERRVVHAGTRLYLDPQTVLYDGIADVKSVCVQMDSKLYILDGQTILVYGEFDVKNAQGTPASVSEQQPPAASELVRATASGQQPLVRSCRAGSLSVCTERGQRSTGETLADGFPQTPSTAALTAKRDTQQPPAASGLAEKQEGEEEPQKEWTVKPITEIATIPTIVISRAPTGGGESFEPVNLLQKKWKESFLGVANAKDYQLSFDNLDDTPLTARKLDSNGDWIELKETTDFTVDRATGKVTFVVAPGASPVTGEDNVEITASREWEGYQQRILNCNIATLFGVSGASDRLFVSGNSEYKNYDWYSGQNDPTYFGDTWYSILGQDDAPIVGYSIVGAYLATHKDGSQDDRNVILRSGQLIDGKAAFPIGASLQGEGAFAPHSFGYLSTEPLFLTRLGVYAITAQDVTGEKYAQSRSYYLNGKLLEEPNLKEAYSLVYKDFYLLALNHHVYVLDGLQVSYEKNAPYSKYQYECYFWDNVPARILFEHDGALCFGDELGRLYAFFEDKEDGNSYEDAGAAIDSYWTFPAFSGKDFYKKKTFRYFAVQVAPAPVTSVRIWAQIRGVWKLIRDETGKTRYFKWSKITWSRFSWSSDQTPRTVGIKIKIKKVDKVIFKLQNDTLHEPFGFYALSLEFTEQGYYKR